VPKFSLVIPTLRRADTFRHALATLLEQTYDDFEIIVQNNAGDAATESVVRAIQDPRIRHFSSDSILSMRENWETALGHTRGDFVTFIGDDDGLFPDACRIASEVFDRSGQEIVSWRPFCYYWPSYIHSDLRNRLIATVDYDLQVQVVSSDDHLRRYYRFAIDYSHLPMIYNSFVHRSVIDDAKRRLGGHYFMGMAPDVASGIVNSAVTKWFALLSRPLSMTGLSHHSFGHTTFLSERAHPIESGVYQEVAAFRADDRFIPTNNNLQIFLSNEMLYARERILLDRQINFDFGRMIEFVAAAINDRPGFYDETFESIRMLAKRHNVDLADVAIPLPTATRPMPKTGSRMIGHRKVHSVIDGDRLGLQTIADAVRLMEQFVPRIDSPGAFDIHRPPPLDRPAVRVGEPVAFGAKGNGRAALGEGWAEPEEWGTWSVSKRASIRLSVEAYRGRRLYAELKYRAFTHDHDCQDIVCRAGDRDVAAWHCNPRANAGIQRMTIPFDAIREGGALDLEFRISNPRAPAELGISADTRQIGLGIEWLRLTTRMGLRALLTRGSR
jgi:glycosyltransferase involved in cell wall biosynthesis